jgi:hypothetical protein
MEESTADSASDSAEPLRNSTLATLKLSTKFNQSLNFSITSLL